MLKQCFFSFSWYVSCEPLIKSCVSVPIFYTDIKVENELGSISISRIYIKILTHIPIWKSKGPFILAAEDGYTSGRTVSSSSSAIRHLTQKAEKYHQKSQGPFWTEQWHEETNHRRRRPGKEQRSRRRMNSMTTTVEIAWAFEVRPCKCLTVCETDVGSAPPLPPGGRIDSTTMAM